MCFYIPVYFKSDVYNVTPLLNGIVSLTSSREYTERLSFTVSSVSVELPRILNLCWAEQACKNPICIGNIHSPSVFYSIPEESADSFRFFQGTRLEPKFISVFT